jgi:EpsI family protein
MRPSAVLLAAGLMLAATAAVQQRTSATVEVAPARALFAFPDRLGEWMPASEPEETLVERDGKADESLLRSYRRGNETLILSLTYYRRQWETRRLLAASHLLPEGGWIEPRRGTIRLPLEGGAIDAATVVMRRGGKLWALAYWYQLGDRAYASDLPYRAALLGRSLWRGRSEGTLVKIVAVMPERDADPFALHRAFARDLYPELLRTVPH